MEKIKFIEPLFDTHYFKSVFLKDIDYHLENDLSEVINQWLIITFYNPGNEYDETQTGTNFVWTHNRNCMGKEVFDSEFHILEDGTTEFEDGTPIQVGIKDGTVNPYKHVELHLIENEDIVDKSYYYDICVKRNFKYLWYSIHKGPHEIPLHIDRRSPLRYVQCIYKNGKHNDWFYEDKNLVLNEGDAFVFDPKSIHGIATESGCESVFLIADCPEWLIDEFHV